MTRRTRSVSPERRAELAAQAAELADRAAAALAAPGAGQRVATTLRMSARIASYSIRNQMLLLEQAEERGINLADVDTFRGWKDRGRCVRKGEHGLKIVRPVGVESTEEPGGKTEKAAEQRAEQREEQREPGERVRFRIMTVFDISQTDGIEDDAAGTDITPAGAEELWNHLAQQIQARGYLFNWPSDDTAEPVRVDHDRRLFHVAPDLDPADVPAVAAVADGLAALMTHLAAERAEQDQAASVA
jgi:antirestriction protein ArdC